MHRRNTLCWSVAILLLAFAVAPAHAVTTGVQLLGDTLDVGASPTVGDDGDDPLDTAWVQGNSTPAISRVDDSSGLGTGFAVNVDTSGTFDGVRGSFPYASLLIGESIEMTFDARFTQLPGNNGGGFRAGLFNLAGIGGTNGTTGYFAQIGTGGSTTLAAAFDVGGGNGNGGGGNDTGLLTGGGGGAAFSSINDLNAHDIQVTVTRTGATTSTTNIVVDGVSRTGMDTDGTIVEAFDNVIVREGGIDADFRFDNINVTHNQLSRLTVTGDPADMEVLELVNGNTTQLTNPSNMLVGHGGGSGGFGREALLVFELPDPGSLATDFAASLEFDLVQKDSTLPFDADLFGLGFTTDQNDLSAFDDYFYSGIAPFSATLLQSSILDADTELGRIESTGTGDTALATFIESLYVAGAQAGDFAVLSLNPSLDPFTSGGTFDRYHIASGSTSTPPSLILEALVVPEPSSVAIFCVCFVSFGFVGWRRRRRYQSFKTLSVNREVLSMRIVSSSCFFVSIASAWFTATTSTAALTWDAGGDGISIYQEANWDDGSGDPPAGTIDPSVPVNDDLIATFGTPGGPVGGNPHLDLGASGSLSVSGTAVFRMTPVTFAGIRNIGGGDAAGQPTAIVSDSSTLLAQFFADVGVTLADEATITLYGGGDPIVASSTINFTSATSTLNMLDESVGDFISEHLGKITVLGAPAVLGENLLVVSDGGSGSIVSGIIVPEPSSLVPAFLSLLSLSFVGWRRRRR